MQRIFFRCAACKIARARFSLTEERRSEKGKKGTKRTRELSERRSASQKAGGFCEWVIEFALPKVDKIRDIAVPIPESVYLTDAPGEVEWRQSRLRISEAVDRKSQSRESSIRKM